MYRPLPQIAIACGRAERYHGPQSVYQADGFRMRGRQANDVYGLFSATPYVVSSSQPPSRSTAAHHEILRLGAENRLGVNEDLALVVITVHTLKVG
jgi:hypothetical protein